MSNAANFVWYDVMTDDVPAAEAFYTSVIGWTARDAGTPGVDYTLFRAGDAMTGGLMPIPGDARAAGVRPAWMGYIGVEDVDYHAKQVVAAGGVIHRQPWDIPGVGRVAVAGDPDGAGFMLFSPKPAQVPPPVATRGTPGHFAWRELRAGDSERAFAFYSRLFGWAKDMAVDMGAMGTYQTFTAGGALIGGMMTKPADAPAHWFYYINVEAIDAAIARAERAGGTLISGPHQVPTGEWMMNGRDPRGALFGLLAPRR